MKIYHLIICYNDETEELEYIEEYVEDVGSDNVPYAYREIKLDEEWADEDLMAILNVDKPAKA